VRAPASSPTRSPRSPALTAELQQQQQQQQNNHLTESLFYFILLSLPA
jgi:hypothetical protein